MGEQSNRGSARSGNEDRLRRLREADFAVIDAQLYRDIYPDCAQAEQYLAEMRKERRRAMEEFEQQYGSLTIYGDGAACSVTPWKYEAN